MIKWLKDKLGLNELESRIEKLEKERFNLIRDEVYFKDRNFIFDCLNIDYDKLIKKYKWVKYKQLHNVFKSYLEVKYELQYESLCDFAGKVWIKYKDNIVGNTELCLGEILEKIIGEENG